MSVKLLVASNEESDCDPLQTEPGPSSFLPAGLTVCAEGIPLRITTSSPGDGSRTAVKPEDSPQQFSGTNAVTAKGNFCPPLREYDSSAFYIEMLQLD